MAGHPKEEDINDIFDSFRPQIDEHIGKWLPRKFTLESMTELAGPAHYAYDLESATNALLVPIWDILDRGTCPFYFAECHTTSCSASSSLARNIVLDFVLRSCVCTAIKSCTAVSIGGDA